MMELKRREERGKKWCGCIKKNLGHKHQGASLWKATKWRLFFEGDNDFLVVCITIYTVDLKVWSKLAKRARNKRIASKFARNFECDLQRVNMFSHCVTLTHVLLPQIISCSDTKVSVLVVMECNRANVISVQS